MKKTLPILAALTLLFGFSPSAVALTINDPGVVGIMEGQVQVEAALHRRTKPSSRTLFSR